MSATTPQDPADTPQATGQLFERRAAREVLNLHQAPRPSDLQGWQKVLGTIGWVAMVLTPHGWVVLAVSFTVFTAIGRTPHDWFLWVTKYSAIFIVVSLVVLALYLMGSADG